MFLSSSLTVHFLTKAFEMFCLIKTSFSIVSNFNNVLLHITMFPARKNTFLDDVEDAGIHKTFLATPAERGSSEE